MATTLRLIHTSDWHLGRQLYGKSLIEDQSASLDSLVELIERSRPHALLIAGDVFDRPLPPEAAVGLFDRFLTEVAGKRQVPVIMIPGNHDSCERLGFASSLLRDRGVTIFSTIEDSFAPVYIKGDGNSGALIYGIPFVEPFEIGRVLGRDDTDTPEAATEALCKEILKRKTEPHPAVLLCHALVAGGETSESERELFIGGASSVHPRVFEGFAYTALGHLHKPQRAGSERIRYSGSLLPYSKSEASHKKAVNEVILHPDGEVEIKAHHLSQLRNLRYIEGELAEILLEAPNDSSPDDYVIVGLTDKGAVIDAFSKLHRHYPRLLHVSRANRGAHTELEISQARARERESMSDLELFADFFQSVTGTALDETERQSVIDVLTAIERGEREP